jgi:hypothetical protein
MSDARAIYGDSALFHLDKPELPMELWNVECAVTLMVNVTVAAPDTSVAAQLAPHEVPLDAMKEYAHDDGYDVENIDIRVRRVTRNS